MPRKDKKVTSHVTQKLQDLGYKVAEWDDSATLAPDEVQKVLGTASKSKTGKQGIPDRVYWNGDEKLLVLVEEKPEVQMHELEDPAQGAVSGIKWYLSRFINANLNDELKDYFLDFKIIGIAVSGDIETEFANKFDAFYIDQNEQKILSIPQLKNFVTYEEFLSVFNNLNEEQAIAQVGASSKKINNLLRSIDSQKRPVLLSALMISLYKPLDENGNSAVQNNDFPNLYKQYSASTIVNSLSQRVKDVLASQNIPNQKIKALDSELGFIQNDSTLLETNILKNILDELNNSVIPLFNSRFSTTSNYDIIGKFYEEFLRYAGVSNVKKGIVLTPRHITTLFTKLVPLKYNDVVMDLTSGTGAFLIAAMNEMIKQIEKSDSSDIKEKIRDLKSKQLLGFEINPTMYISSISNMMFRNDGKSSIYNMDSINNDEVDEIIDEYKPTIGFMNPPYSGKENNVDPTPKEITFIKKMLRSVSRYGVVIAPISTYFKDTVIRSEILQDNTLKYVINMPKDLFAPNAASQTAIAVFETHSPHDYENDEVVFYDLKDDGFALTKNKGRTDVYGKWNDIQNDLLDAVLHGKVKDNGATYLRKTIKKGDEWTVQQHLKVDYSKLSIDSFISTIADYVMFTAKKDMRILNKKLSDFHLYSAFNEYFSGKLDSNIELEKNYKINTDNWKEFNLIGNKEAVFESYDNGKRLTSPNRIPGDVPFLTAGEQNQSLSQYIGNYQDDELCSPSITIDMFFNVFYQNYSFASDDNVYHFINSKLNIYSSLFIVSVLNLQKAKYGFGRQFRKKNAENTTIKLPAKEDGSLDFEFMESFIKKLPFSDMLEND